MVHEEVRWLIGAHIVSVEQLEMLLLLHRYPSRSWTVAEIADELRTSELSAATRLDDLRQRGFLAESDDPHAAESYRYAPANRRIARAVDLLEEEYQEHRYTVIELIFAKPIDNLRLYADAFRFRKGDSDG